MRPRLRLSGRYAAHARTAPARLFSRPSRLRAQIRVSAFPASARLTHVRDQLWMQEVEFVGPEVRWTLPFEKAAPPVVKKEPNAP
jgi:hypothetical protein